MNDNDWLVVDSSEEAEDAMAWLQGIGGGAATGAATGAVAGPWGAVIGGAVGAGLGALSTHQQQQAQAQANRTAQRQRAASSPRPAPRQAAPARATQPAAAPMQQRAAPVPAATAGVAGAADVLNELRTLMPALRQLAAGLVAVTAPPATAAGVVAAEFRAPRPAWEVAEDVAIALENVADELADAAVGHPHPQPHPSARDSGTPGHRLHDLHRNFASIAGQVRQS